jgi:hypothetical protein
MEQWKHLFRAQLEIQRVFSMSLLREEYEYPHHELRRLLASYGLDMSRSRLALDPRKEYYDVIYQYGIAPFCGVFLKERIQRSLSRDEFPDISHFEDTGLYDRFENAARFPWPNFYLYNYRGREQMSPWCRQMNEIIRTNF